MKADCHLPSSCGQVYTDTEALSPDTRTIIGSINVNFTEILHVNCRGYFVVNYQAEILIYQESTLQIMLHDQVQKPRLGSQPCTTCLLTASGIFLTPHQTVLSIGQNCSLLQIDCTWNLYTSHQNGPVLRLGETRLPH